MLRKNKEKIRQLEHEIEYLKRAHSDLEDLLLELFSPEDIPEEKRRAIRDCHGGFFFLSHDKIVESAHNLKHCS